MVFMPEDNEKEQLAKLIGLIQEAIQQDERLRQTYQVGEKFRFISDRLKTLLEHIQKETVTHEKKIKIAEEVKVEEDETLVYVHLYNAQGLVVRTWQAMITPKAYFDFSVNRPLYLEKSHIEDFIRTKPNNVQHAYLIVAMKKERILPIHEEGIRDPLGNPLIKIKEGSLHYERTVAFVHNGVSYQCNEKGELIRKTEKPAETSSEPKAVTKPD
jgi:hypothetical protein